MFNCKEPVGRGGQDLQTYSSKSGLKVSFSPSIGGRFILLN